MKSMFRQKWIVAGVLEPSSGTVAVGDRTWARFVIDLQANAIRLRVPGLPPSGSGARPATLDVGANGRLVGIEVGESYINVMPMPGAMEPHLSQEVADLARRPQLGDKGSASLTGEVEIIEPIKRGAVGTIAREGQFDGATLAVPPHQHHLAARVEVGERIGVDIVDQGAAKGHLGASD